MIAKLLLEDKEFAAKLNKNKAAVQGFGAAGDVALGVLGKFAGVFGVAMTGMEAFNRVMESSQTIADAWGGTLYSAQVSVDNFFYAIGSGDFSAFIGGIEQMIARAREAYNALDDLGNVAMSYNYANAQDAAKLQDLINVARDTSVGEYDRRVALNDAKELQGQMRANAEEYRRTSMEALRKELQASSGVVDGGIFTDEVIDRMLRLDISSTRAVERARYADKYRAYKTDAEALRMLMNDERQNLSIAEAGRDRKYLELPKAERAAARERDAAQAREAIQRYAGELLELQQRYSEVIAYNAALEIASDDKLNEYGQRIITAENAVRAVSGQLRTIQGVERRLNKDLAGGKGEELSTKKEYKLSEFDASLSSHSWEEAFRGEEKFNAAQKAADKEKWEKLGVPDKLEGIDDKEITSPDKTKRMQEYCDAVNGLSNAFATLGTAIDGSTGAWLSWIGTAIQAGAQIAANIGKLAAETAAHKANATAAAQSAGAEAMEAHASIPFAGVAIGAGMVATIVATLMSMPKFAKGGIVTGPTVGLIGEAGPEAVIPLHKLESMMANTGREVRVVGTLRARGKDLVGTIDNYNNALTVR